MTEILQGIDRLYRRIVGIMSAGWIGPVRDGGKVQMMQVALNPVETVDNLARIAEYGFCSNPPAGAHAICIFANGDRSNGVVIATGDARYRITSLNPGEVAIHNDGGQVVTLGQTGMKLDGGGKQITLTNAPEIRMETPLLKVTGDIYDRCDDSLGSFESLRIAYNEHYHEQANDSGHDTEANTDPPIPQVLA